MGTDRVSFDIKAPGINSGVFVIKNISGETVFGANIKKGGVKLAQQVLEDPGYYYLTISNSADNARPQSFEIYLEPGNYQIEPNVQDASIYPAINSPSLAQKELSAFYLSVGIVRSLSRYPNAAAMVQVNTDNSKSKQLAAWLKKVEDGPQERDKIEKVVLQTLVSNNPKSITAAHIMSGLDLTADPLTYYRIYKQLSASEQNSFEGAPLGETLGRLVKLLPGQPAPPVLGLSPNGKPFKITDYKKKIYLVEFWKAGNELSRIQHSKVNMENFIGGIHKKDDLGIIGISLDNKRDWWTSAIIEDGVSWPQYSDLKGNESENITNWAATRMPIYFLVDGNWHMLDRDISQQEATVVINQYLDHH